MGCLLSRRKSWFAREVEPLEHTVTTTTHLPIGSAKRIRTLIELTVQKQQQARTLHQDVVLANSLARMRKRLDEQAFREERDELNNDFLTELSDICADQLQPSMCHGLYMYACYYS